MLIAAARYWPEEEDEPDVYGDIKVSHVS